MLLEPWNSRLIGIRLEKSVDAIDRPMLVFLKRGSHGHFVVIRPIGHTGKLVQVIDSARGTEVVDKSDLINSPDWTGLALIPVRTDWQYNLALGLALVIGLLVAFRLVLDDSGLVQRTAVAKPPLTVSIA